MNIPAVFILLLLSLLLIRGTRESAVVNNLIVITKVSIVLLVIAIGWQFINPANHTPFIPAPTTYTTPQGVTHAYGGIMGILGAAGVVFFAFIGFDAVSTAAQETRNPKRDMPAGILGSLVLCTVLYVLFSYVLSGVATVEDFRTQGREASVAFAIEHYMTGYGWLAKLVTVAILAGFSSVILVMLLGQSRVFYAMSKDGLVPPVFAAVHPKYRTPYKSQMLFFVFTALFAAFIPENIVGEMTSIGTLFAFILVCAGVWIMRVRRPDIPRGFVVPAVPVVSTLGIVVCGAMAEIEPEAEQHVRVFELGQIGALQQRLMDIDRTSHLAFMPVEIADDHLDFERIGAAAGGVRELVDRLIELVLRQEVQPEHVVRRLSQPPPIDPPAVAQLVPLPRLADDDAGEEGKQHGGQRVLSHPNSQLQDPSPKDRTSRRPTGWPMCLRVGR